MEELRTADLLLDAEARWDDAFRAATLLAIAPETFRGAVLMGGPCPARQAWLTSLADLSQTPLFTVSGHTDYQAVSGGRDLLGSLTAGEERRSLPLASRAAGHILLVRSADQLRPEVIHHLADDIDHGRLRDGIVLCDEDDEPRALPTLRERLAFALDLSGIPLGFLGAPETNTETAATARRSWRDVHLTDEHLENLSQAALLCGADSMRALLFAVDAVKVLAALEERQTAQDEDVIEAARLILAPRATRQPPREDTPPQDHIEEAPEQQDEQPEQHQSSDEDRTAAQTEALEDAIIEAISSGAVSLALLQRQRQANVRRAKAGRAGEQAESRREGRPIGTKPGDPRTGIPIDLLATLKQAAPWQRLRAREGQKGIAVYPSDLRIKRYAHKTATSVIFVVDASGSSAAQRLAEVKGAVESLLAECYSRRDTVALIAFRGEAAELILPPSRSLTRARRALAGLPGGGGTPFPSAMALALDLAMREKADGRRPLLVYMSDARGNITLSGEHDRSLAADEAATLARRIAAAGIDTVFFDTSRRPQDKVRLLSESMGGRYVPLPYADGMKVAAAVAEERQAGRRG
jgi:magnesium chelatase subunit D